VLDSSQMCQGADLRNCDSDSQLSTPERCLVAAAEPAGMGRNLTGRFALREMEKRTFKPSGHPLS
jgi:hypothetical protein